MSTNRPGGPPKGMTAPPGAPPSKTIPANPAEAAPSKQTELSKIPKAPPINWFHAWICGEPFGENIQLVEQTDKGNAIPDHFNPAEASLGEILD